MSASGVVASVAFPPCPTHFFIAHKTAALTHSSGTSSLRAADCNVNTTPPAHACRLIVEVEVVVECVVPVVIVEVIARALNSNP